MSVFKLLNLSLIGSVFAQLMPNAGAVVEQTDTMSEIASTLAAKGQIETVERIEDVSDCRAILSLHQPVTGDIEAFRVQLVLDRGSRDQASYLACVATEEDGSQNFEYFPEAVLGQREGLGGETQ